MTREEQEQVEEIQWLAFCSQLVRCHKVLVCKKNVGWGSEVLGHRGSSICFCGVKRLKFRSQEVGGHCSSESVESLDRGFLGVVDLVVSWPLHRFHGGRELGEQA